MKEGDCASEESLAFSIVAPLWTAQESLTALRFLLVLASGSADVKKILFDSAVLEASNFKLARLYAGRSDSKIQHVN